MIATIIYVLIIVAIVAADQITKALTDGLKSVEIIKDFLYISSTKNTGAAFSMLGDAPWAQTFFLVLTVIAVLAAIFFLVFNKKKSKWLDTSVVIIIGGAIGNFIDRVSLSYVRDFIYVTIFANFNVADIAISVGAIMLIVYLLFIDADAVFKSKKK